MGHAKTCLKASVMAAAALAASAPGILSAQSTIGARSGTGTHFHLMQLSVKSGEVPLQRFREETQTIRDCGDAREVGEALGADIRKNRWVPAWKIPKPVKAVLEEVETGHATGVFSNEPGIMRVIVICHRL
ncbi:hypothetical protein K3162_12475 [Qipengyuania xiapuensis]|uniref:Uncharacterized protein n=1 Tax=Qipengyuania xiapuensis TaxID=2867236 RepID=A0ABX8ZTH2_9SPHN|nr:hypothetical protein [Qipengyuania xiapuensis]QZD92331.1 hypothetical protein K3162_12475 [Qipengyuania xiapuensis]